MFVAASKLLDLALEPLVWVLALGVAAALALRRRPRLGAALGLAGAALLYAASVEAVAGPLQRALEAPAQPTLRPEQVYDVAVVLSGAVDDDASRASGELELTGSADRIVGGYALWRSGRARQLALVGGPVARRPGPTEPERVAALLRSWGVPADRLVLEQESRNTHENAVAAARLARAQGWRTMALVTSAAHVPRALACFRHEGLAPDVLPVDHRAAAGRAWWPRADNLAATTRALREWAGRLVYRLVGYA